MQKKNIRVLIWSVSSGIGAVFIMLGSIGSAQAACGLVFQSGDPIIFGELARDTVSSEQTLTLVNTGDDTGTVTVSGTNWKSGAGTVHIAGGMTRFATTDQGEDTAYQDKTPLNSTNGAITFGAVPPVGLIGSNNATYWQLHTTLQNLPFSGTLTQVITFTVTC